LSRGVSPARSWGLRGSGEELLLRRPGRLVSAVRALPRGVVDRLPILATPPRGRRPPPAPSRPAAGSAPARRAAGGGLQQGGFAAIALEQGHLAAIPRTPYGPSTNHCHQGVRRPAVPARV